MKTTNKEVVKHTPGPWKKHISGPMILSKDGTVIARVSGLNTDADCRLIAAAPELLEALKNMVHIWEINKPENGWNGNIKNYLDKAQAVIAKAEGRG